MKSSELNKFNSVLESCHQFIKSRTPEQIAELQRKFDELPADGYFTVPDDFEIFFPDKTNTCIYNITTTSTYLLISSSPEYSTSEIYDVVSCPTRLGFGQASDFIKPAA